MCSSPNSVRYKYHTEWKGEHYYKIKLLVHTSNKLSTNNKLLRVFLDSLNSIWDLISFYFLILFPLSSNLVDIILFTTFIFSHFKHRTPPRHRTFSVQIKTGLFFYSNILSLLSKKLVSSFRYVIIRLHIITIRYKYLKHLDFFDYFYCDEWPTAIKKVSLVSWIRNKLKLLYGHSFVYSIPSCLWSGQTHASVCQPTNLSRGPSRMGTFKKLL